MLVRAWTSPDNRSVSPQAGSHTGARGRALGQDSEAPRLPLGPSYSGEPQESLWGAGGSGRKKQILRSNRLCTCRYPRLLGQKGSRTYILLLCCYHHTQASSLNLGRKCAEKNGANQRQKTELRWMRNTDVYSQEENPSLGRWRHKEPQSRLREFGMEPLPC